MAGETTEQLLRRQLDESEARVLYLLDEAIAAATRWAAERLALDDWVAETNRRLDRQVGTNQLMAREKAGLIGQVTGLEERLARQAAEIVALRRQVEASDHNTDAVRELPA